MAANCEWVDVGNGLNAYYGRPDGVGPHPCLVVYIEAFGVNQHFKKLTLRLANAGFSTIIPDIYGGDTYSYEDMDGAIEKLKTMDDDIVMQQTEKHRAMKVPLIISSQKPIDTHHVCLFLTLPFHILIYIGCSSGAVFTMATRFEQLVLRAELR